MTGDTLRFSALTGERSMNEVFPLERAAEAYEHMMSGKARFRVVLTDRAISDDAVSRKRAALVWREAETTDEGEGRGRERIVPPSHPDVLVTRLVSSHSHLVIGLRLPRASQRRLWLQNSQCARSGEQLPSICRSWVPLFAELSIINVSASSWDAFLKPRENIALG